MSDISVRAGQTYSNTDQRWIAGNVLSALRDLDGITLARNQFDLVTTFPNGYIPSGICLGKVTAAGATQNMYGPYDDAATDGTQVAVGFLAVPVTYDRNSTANIAGAALMWKGEVVEAFLPTNHGLDAAGKTDLAAKFRFV